MKAIGKFVALAGLGALQSLAGGFVLSKLWLWFIVSKFSAPTLGYVEAVGVQMVVSFMLCGLHMSVVGRAPKSDGLDDYQRATAQTLGMLIGAYPLALLAGYIWSQFL